MSRGPLTLNLGGLVKNFLPLPHSSWKEQPEVKRKVVYKVSRPQSVLILVTLGEGEVDTGSVNVPGLCVHEF